MQSASRRPTDDVSVRRRPRSVPQPFAISADPQHLAPLAAVHEKVPNAQIDHAMLGRRRFRVDPLAGTISGTIRQALWTSAGGSIAISTEKMIRMVYPLAESEIGCQDESRSKSSGLVPWPMNSRSHAPKAKKLRCDCLSDRRFAPPSNSTSSN